MESMSAESPGGFEEICLHGTGLCSSDFLRLNHIFGWLTTRVRDRLNHSALDRTAPGRGVDQPTWEVTLPWGERGVLELDPVWPTLWVDSSGLGARARAWPVPVDLLAPRDRRYLEVECRWSRPRCVVPEYLSPKGDPDRCLVDVLCRAAFWMGHVHANSTESHRRQLDRAG